MKRHSVKPPLLRILLACACACASAGSAAAGEAGPYLSPYLLEMTSIPAGTFRMGSEIGNKDERPIRDVAVAGFMMGRTEVTVGWYLRCMADGICEAPSWWSIGYFEDVQGHTTPAASMALPITGISWKQARMFCAWLGPEFSLPTEAEWEYAAGAGKSQVYSWGDRAEDRFQGAQRPQEPKGLMPVASSPANALGLFDMGGGVWEWVLDCYKEDKRTRACTHRVSKGGSWSEHLWNLRVANRSFGLEDQGYKGLGFRVVYHAP